jgi:hypothetical protein
VGAGIKCFWQLSWPKPRFVPSLANHLAHKRCKAQ